MMQELQLLTESSNWKSRPVSYVAGNWNQIKERIPKFELSDFAGSDDGVVNPYYRTVIRLPLTPMEHRIPVGIVSNSYTLSGRDVKYADPFEAALPTEKSVIKLDNVPGSNEIAKNIFDVSQALSWLATNRNNAEEKTDWQMQIPELLNELISY